MKQIVKNFNNLIKKTIFKVQNKTNNKLQISNFNKYLITLISLLFFYLFYLSIPVLYDKIWLQHNIESRLLKEFKINFSTSSEISYRILPKPHFLVNDSKIFIQDSKKTNSIANIKNLKIFINQSNFFNKEKMIIKNLEIDNANFSLQRKDLRLLNDLSYKKFSSKKIKVKNSNIFFKDNSNETVVIIKIDNSILFFDKKELLNLVNLKAEVFNVPFTFKMKNQINLSKDREINIKAQTLKLNILNKSSKEKNNSTLGNNTISFLNSKINTKYNTKKNLINFKSGNSRINKSKIEYNGNFSINPFDLKFNIDLGNYKISKILDVNSILTSLIKTELLFNDKISVNASIIKSLNPKQNFFHSAKINLDIMNGKINFDKTKLINKKIGLLELENSNLYFKNNDLILSSNIIITINDTNELYSLLQTNKKFRKPIKKILINLDYNFLTNEIKFNNFKIDNKVVSDQLFRIMDKFSDIELNNFNKSKRVFNEIFKNYDG